MKQLVISQQITSRAEVSLEKYLSDISKIQLISVEEEALLARRIKMGDQRALKEMIQANLRFVISVSKQYQNLGLSLPDLINEGNLGLIKAAHRFDETRGFRFISYAVWWIRHSIIHALADQARIIKLPVYQVGLLNRINRTAVELEQRYEREPTCDELSTELEQDTNDIRNLMNISSQALSLDAPIDQENTSMYELLSDVNSVKPDNSLETESLCTAVEQVVDSLPPREALVIRLFYGLNGYSQHGIDEIATRMDISTTLVRTLREKALDRLRSPKRNKLLKVFLD